MPRVPEDTIEQIRQSVDIVEVLSDYVMLTKRGKNYLGLCPFHDDRSPSMNVSQDKQIYKCFSCGAGGNVYTFLMELERISFIEAVRKLAGQAGVALPEEGGSEDRGKQESFDPLYNANELARKYFHHMLTADDCGKEAREYLNARGLTDETIKTFSLGFAPDSWDGLLLVAGRRGFSPQNMEKAGLASPRNEAKGFYDRFRNRVMFPIQSHTGRTVAFGARALDPEEKAKYLNSPETPIYHKSAILYGLWNSRDAIRTQDTALVVEGYMDLIALAQRGIQNTVASSGTALTEDHGRLLRRYTRKAVLVFDGDAAGAAASVRGIGSLLEVGIETRIVTLPEGQDPDSFVSEHGPDAFRGLLEDAQPVLDFLIHWIATQEDLTTADGKARALETLVGFVGRIKDETLRRFTIQEAAEKMGTDEATLVGVLKRTAGRERPRRPRPTDEPTPEQFVFDPSPRAERELLILMMAHDYTADTVLAQIRPEEFSNSVYRRIAALIAECRQQGHTAGEATLLDHNPNPDLAHIISALSLETGILNPDRPEAGLPDYIHRFRLKTLEAQIDHIKVEIRKDGADTRTLMEKLQGLTRQRKALADARQAGTPTPATHPPV